MVGIIVVVLLLTQYPNVKKDALTYIDIPGFVLMAVSATCAVLAFNWVSTRGWTDPLVVVLLVLFVVCAIAFVFAERKSKAPLIDMGLFKNKYFVLCLLAACAIWPCMFASNAYFTLYAQSIRGMTATASGRHPVCPGHREHGGRAWWLDTPSPPGRGASRRSCW